MAMVRRTFLQRSAIAGGGLAAAGPLGLLSARTASGAPPPSATGYGPLVPKGDLALRLGSSTAWERFPTWAPALEGPGIASS
jgi:hypothetical protein